MSQSVRLIEEHVYRSHARASSTKPDTCWYRNCGKPRAQHRWFRWRGRTLENVPSDTPSASASEQES